MLDWSNDLTDEQLMGVWMGLGAGIGMMIGYSAGLLTDNLLLWGPTGIALGISLGAGIWVATRDDTAERE